MPSEAETRKTVESLEKEVQKLTGDVAVALQQMEDWRMMAKVLAQELEGKNLEIKALRSGKAAEALQLESQEATKECEASGSKRQRFEESENKIIHDDVANVRHEDEGEGDDDYVDEVVREESDEDADADADDHEDNNVDELISEESDDDWSD